MVLGCSMWVIWVKRRSKPAFFLTFFTSQFATQRSRVRIPLGPLKNPVFTAEAVKYRVFCFHCERKKRSK